MHEIGIVRQIRRTVEEFAAENSVSKISAVVVECGELSLIIPRYLQELYPVVTKDSILAGTELVIEEIPGMAQCSDCDEIFDVVDHKGYCPACGSFRKQVLTGQQFNIKEIRLPE